ncbi:bestrophin-2-like isoform X2 [Macrobrachium rosenbergii]|uniref:bestrophin-2-like isoform X2 n=1 Tax=Macrobrachium rosenbergii TaxID=79674 RepID=UPI0034D7AFB7
MTVTYSKQISTTSFCLFSRLLLRWRGSVFKLIWKDLIFFLALYASCSAVYRCALTEPQKRIFEKIALVCESYRNAAPISFILGFYVSIVVSRWWEQYMLIPWPDDVCLLTSAYIQGKDARCISLRRGVARYINLAFVLSVARISPRVAKVYPNYDHLVKAEYLTAKEKSIMDMVDEVNNHHQVWDPLPLLWASLVVTKARKEGYIPDDHSQEALIHEITNLRYSCSKLQEYSHMSVPLVYTQVTTMATYTYILCSVVGRQFLDPEQGYKDHLIDLYVPMFTILQFIFYMGWLKVAESLLNPFGDDDDDFDINELLERHLEVSYLMVDGMHRKEPHLLLDLEEKTGPYNARKQQQRQHNNIAPTQQNPEFLYSCANPTESCLPREEEETAMSEQPASSNSIATKIVVIDTHEAPVTKSSEESFCSTATAIPNLNKLQRSRSLTSTSQSSSECSYDSCFSLIKQISRNNSKNESRVSSTQRRRRTLAPRSASFETLQTNFAGLSETLELLEDDTASI